MHSRLSRHILAAVTAAFVAARPVLAQESTAATPTPNAHADSSASPGASREHAPHLAYGTTAGALSWSDGHSEQALSGIVQYQPREWLVLSVNPSFVRVTDTTGFASVSGVADLPVAAGLTHAFAGAWHPSLGLSSIVGLPLGDSDAGLGTGRMMLSGEAAVSVEPREALYVRVGAWHGFTAPASWGPKGAGTSVSTEASYAVAERVNVNVLYDAQLGEGDSTYVPPRLVGGGFALALSGPLTLTMQGSHAINGDGPRWVLSVGIGTAFAGVSPVGATSVRSRVQGAFSSQGSGGPGASSFGTCRGRGGC